MYIIATEEGVVNLLKTLQPNKAGGLTKSRPDF